MKKKDIPQVQHVAKTSWNATYEGIIPEHVQEKFLKSAYNDRNMKKKLKKNSIFVADVNGTIVGFANYSPVTKKGIMVLEAIYIFPEYQGFGIGTALLNVALEKIRNVKEVHLNVEKNNHTALRFYQAKGFIEVGAYDDNFGDHTIHTLEMKRTVSKGKK